MDCAAILSFSVISNSVGRSDSLSRLAANGMRDPSTARAKTKTGVFGLSDANNSAGSILTRTLM